MDAGDGDSVACIRSLTTLEDEEVQKEKSLDDYDRWNIICHKDTPLRQRVALLGDGLADVRLWRLPFAKPLELPESVVVMHSMKTVSNFLRSAVHSPIMLDVFAQIRYLKWKISNEDLRESLFVLIEKAVGLVWRVIKHAILPS